MTEPAISIGERAALTVTDWHEIGCPWPSAAALWAGFMHGRAGPQIARLPADPLPAQAEAFRVGSP